MDSARPRCGTRVTSSAYVPLNGGATVLAVRMVVGADRPDSWRLAGPSGTMNDMAAIEVSRSGDARRLHVHSAAVGAGWFVVAFTALVGSQLSGGLRDWIGELPSVVQGVGATVVLAAAIPLVWPVYIAIGWYEAGLASRIRSGDDSARRPATRLLHGQALVFAAVSVLAVGVAWFYRDADGAGYVSLAWLPLAIIAGLHLRIARALAR